jgi:transcriptional antiterminator RfaH
MRSELPTATGWYAVYSKPQKEELAKFHLRLKSVETFFPRLLLPKFARKRKRIVPLFPNYLFVHINLRREYYTVLWTPGVKRFVSYNDIPARLDDSIAEYMMRQADSEGIVTARPELKVGQEIRVCGGSFDGLMGMLVEAPDAKGRIKVLMKLLNRETNVELPIHMVSGTWIPLRSRGAADRESQYPN